MIDVFRALADKRSRLISDRDDLTERYNRAIADIDGEIDALNKAIATVNNAVQPIICPTCYGTGEERYTDAAGSRDTRPCRDCQGTGIRRDDPGRATTRMIHHPEERGNS